MIMVISDSVANPRRLVVVCFLSWNEKYDQSCVVQAGEHPFVKHVTCVEYPMARVVPGSQLDQLHRAGKLVMKHPLPVELLNRIRTSAKGADISTECYELLREQRFV